MSKTIFALFFTVAFISKGISNYYKNFEDYIAIQSKCNDAFKNKTDCEGTQHQLLLESQFTEEAFKISIRALISRKLIKDGRDTVNVLINFEGPPKEVLGQFFIDEKLVVSETDSYKFDKIDILIKYIHVKEHCKTEVGFKSFDEAGIVNEGRILLKWENERYYFEDISYITSID